MDDEVAFVQFAEIDLGAVAAELLGPLQTTATVRRVAAEKFCAGKNDQLALRKNEAARQRAFEQLDPGDGVAHDFAEALDLAFGLEVNHDSKLAGAPVPQPRRELGALRLDQHEIADREIPDVAVVERAAKILCWRDARWASSFLGTGIAHPSKPTFANQNVGVAARLLGFDLDAQMIGRDVIADESSLVFRGLEQDLDVLQVANGGLGIDVEFTERFDVVAEIFDADRSRRLPRKNVENAAADGELSAGRYLGDAFIAGRDKRFNRAFERRLFASAQSEDSGIQRRRIWRRLIERGASRDNEVRPFLALDPIKEREPFRRDLGIGQNIFDGRQFRFRKKERVRLPVQQTFVEQFLGADIRAQHPKRFPDFSRERGD